MLFAGLLFLALTAGPSTAASLRSRGGHHALEGSSEALCPTFRGRKPVPANPIAANTECACLNQFRCRNVGSACVFVTDKAWVTPDGKNKGYCAPSDIPPPAPGCSDPAQLQSYAPQYGTMGLQSAGVIASFNGPAGHSPRNADRVVPLPKRRTDAMHISPDLSSAIVCPVDISAQKSDDPTGQATIAQWARTFNLPFNYTAEQSGFWSTAGVSGVCPADVTKPRDTIGAYMATNPAPGTREWPGFKPTPVWLTPESSTDEALSVMFFSQIGQHRLEAVRDDDAHAPRGAAIACYLDVAENLEARGGFAQLGGVAYFAEDSSVVGIWRGGQLFTPDGPPGEISTCSVDSDGVTSCKQVTVGWEHAKLALRGTLDAVVTVVDHLIGVHFTKSNAFATACTESLPQSHPLAEFCTPFIYRTLHINFAAVLNLASYGSFVPSSTGLSEQGLKDLFEWGAENPAGGNAWATYPEQWAKQGLKDPLPLHEDGTLLLDAFHDYVRSYLGLFYDYAQPSSCAEDPAVAEWAAKVNDVMPQHDLPAVDSCEQLEETLVTLLFAVSAMHSYVGSLGQDWVDPCFAPWAWREGELCGTPRTDFAKATLVAATSFEQPRILYDYSHVFSRQDAKDLWPAFTASLEDVNAQIDGLNAGRAHPFYSFMPVNLETAVSV